MHMYTHGDMYYVLGTFELNVNFQQKSTKMFFFTNLVSWFIYKARVSCDNCELNNLPLFLGEPDWLNVSESVRAYPGTTAYLYCIPIAVPTATVRWQTGGGSSLAQNGRFFEFSNGTLRFTDIREDDSGYYVCTASNRYGSIVNTIQLTVLGKY